MSDDESIAEAESKVLTVLRKIDENISRQDIDVVHSVEFVLAPQHGTSCDLEITM